MGLVRRSSVVVAWLCLGCGSASTEGGVPKPEPEPVSAPTPAPIPEPVSPPKPHVPTRALPEVVITNPGHACAELPAAAAGESESRTEMRPYAVALRRLACEPELFGKTNAELVAELGLPAEAEVGFSDLRGVRLQLPGEPTVGDVAAVFGVDTPQVHVTWQAYHPITSLGTSATTGTFDLWGPGRVWIGVAHEVDRYGEDAGQEKILPAPSEHRIDTSVSVGMPAAVVGMKPDPDAIPLVVAALEQLAARPELLAKAPTEVATAIGLVGERFDITETSTHSQDVVTRGISIDPQRTTVPAAALAEALGLQDAKAFCTNREHDVWELQAGGTTQIVWRGLELDITVSTPEGDAVTQPLGDVEVRYLRIMPRGV